MTSVNKLHADVSRSSIYLLMVKTDVIHQMPKYYTDRESSEIKSTFNMVLIR